MGFKTAVLLFVTIYVSITTSLPLCVCTREFRPVCGSDGQTYSNQCQFDCAKSKNPVLALAKMGYCISNPLNDPCVCTFEYKPVCGTDGIIYPNACALGCSQSKGKDVEIKHDGLCEEVQIVPIDACVCTKEKSPQCGSDGVTYSNPCRLRCAAQTTGVRLAYAGTCKLAPYLRSRRSQPNN